MHTNSYGQNDCVALEPMFYSYGAQNHVTRTPQNKQVKTCIQRWKLSQTHRYQPDIESEAILSLNIGFGRS